MLDVWAYLPGWDLFHKIAVTSKYAREKILKAGLLDQDKVVTLRRRVCSSTKCVEVPPFNSFLYAIELSDAIQIQVDSLSHLDFIQPFFDFMKFAYASLKKDKIHAIDIMVDVKFE